MIRNTLCGTSTGAICDLRNLAFSLVRNYIGFGIDKLQSMLDFGMFDFVHQELKIMVSIVPCLIAFAMFN